MVYLRNTFYSSGGSSSSSISSGSSRLTPRLVRFRDNPIAASIDLFTINRYIAPDLEPREGTWQPKYLVFCPAALVARGFKSF